MQPTIEQVEEAIRKAVAANDGGAVKKFITIHKAMKQESVEVEAEVRKEETAFQPTGVAGTVGPEVRDIGTGLYEGVTGIGGRLVDKLSGLGSEYVDNRTSPLSKRTEAPKEGPESLKQLTGYAISEAVIPAFGELVVQGIKTFGDVASTITPDSLEKPIVEKAKKVWYDMVNSATGEQVLAGAESALKGPEFYQEWKAEQSPQTVRDLESTINIAAFFAPTPKTKSISQDTNIVEEAGSSLVGMGKKQQAKRKRVDLENSFMPIDEKHAKDILGGGGKFTMKDGKTYTYEPSAREVEMYDELSKINTIDKHMPFLTMRDNIKVSLEKLRKNTDSRVIELGNPKIPKGALGRNLQEQMEQLYINQDFIGIAGNEKVAQATVSWLQSAISKSDGTAKGVLQVRRDFDQWIGATAPKALDPNTTNTRSMVVKRLRTYLNDAVEDAVPDAKVKESLKRQSLLYNAIDFIEPKFEKQSQTVMVKLGNAVQKAGFSIPRTPVGIVTTASIAASFLASKFLPLAAAGTGAVGAVGVAYQTMRSARGKVYVGNVIKASSKLIRKTADPILKNQYRADRAVLLAFLSEEQKQEKQNAE